MPPPVEGPTSAETTTRSAPTVDNKPAARTGRGFAKIVSGFKNMIGSRKTVEGMAAGTIPPPDAHPVGAQAPEQASPQSVQAPEAQPLQPDGGQAEASVPPTNPSPDNAPGSQDPIDQAEASVQGQSETQTAQPAEPAAGVEASQPANASTPESPAQPDAETAARQEKAFQDINNRLNYVVEPNTNPSELFSKLVKKEGWTPDAASANHVRDAVAFAKNHASPEVAAAASARVAPASPDVQLEAFNKIDPLYKVTADTDPAVLMANLVQNQGWEANAETAAYVQAAVDHMNPGGEVSTGQPDVIANRESGAQSQAEEGVVEEQAANDANTETSADEAPVTEVDTQIKAAVDAAVNEMKKNEQYQGLPKEKKWKWWQYVLNAAFAEALEAGAAFGQIAQAEAGVGGQG